MKKDSISHAGTQWGNYISSHAQDGTEVLHRGMDLFLKKSNQVKNVDYEQAASQMRAYREQLEIQMKNYVREEKEMLQGFIDTFEYNLETGDNYDQAIYAIVKFSNRAGIALQHVKMNDFKKAMVKEDSFVL